MHISIPVAGGVLQHRSYYYYRKRNEMQAATSCDASARASATVMVATRQTATVSVSIPTNANLPVCARLRPDKSIVPTCPGAAINRIQSILHKT